MTNAEREAATASALVAAAKTGDQRAFDALVKRYRKRLIRKLGISQKLGIYLRSRVIKVLDRIAGRQIRKPPPQGGAA